MSVDALDPERAGKAIVSGVSVCDTRCSDLNLYLAISYKRHMATDHASLSHGKRADDRQRQKGDGGLLW